MNQVHDYPLSYEDEDNREFLAAWREEGRLVLQQAAEGGKPFFYPRPLCPYTGSRELISLSASGIGKIVSYSFVMRPNHPAFNAEVPIILAEIVLEEGALLLGRIISDDISTIASGRAVELVSPETAKRYPLPAFRIREAGNE